MGLYSTVMDSIEAYTGLSPAAFFTIAVLMVVVYKAVCSMFLGPEDFKKPVREPVQLGDVTERELRAYNGSDPNKPLLMAIKGSTTFLPPGRFMVLEVHMPCLPEGMRAGPWLFCLLTHETLRETWRVWASPSWKYCRTGKTNSWKSMSRLVKLCQKDPATMNKQVSSEEGDGASPEHKKERRVLDIT